MAYFTDLFTVKTYEAFLKSPRGFSGFRESQQRMADRLKPGDKLLCYVNGLSRWAAVLEVSGKAFIDRTPLFIEDNDPFAVRVPVKTICSLPLENAIPIRTDNIFDNLSFTKGKGDGYWLGPLRRSLQHISDADGQLLEAALMEQLAVKKTFPLDQKKFDRLQGTTVNRADGAVTVTVPDDETEVTPLKGKSDWESIRMQAAIAKLGEEMGFRIWLPKNDRSAVCANWKPQAGTLIDVLPLNYDNVTIATIEQIDVLWLKGRSIRRAFEVEHTTAIYSGILRMADLLALQPNMNILLHIVAPMLRQEKVFTEIRRPVFSMLEGKPLVEQCTFIAYEDLKEIMSLPHLSHLSDSIISEYEVVAGD